MKKQKALTLAKPFHLALISLVAVSALTTFAAGAISHFTHNAEAAPVSGTVNVRAVLDYSLTMSLGNAYSDCAALADNGAVVPINPTPNDTLYYNCLNALVNTDSPAGYNLSLQTSTPALTSGANTIPALAGTIAAPTTMPSDRWGFCVPNTHAQNVANGFTTSCTVSPLFAAVPTAPTIIKNVDTLPTTPDQQNTPIHFGVRTTATSAPGTYTSLVTITAAINTP